MANHRFSLTARVSTENPTAIKRALKEFMPEGSITATEEGFVVRAKLTGTSARELNRNLLSALRRIERKTQNAPNSKPSKDCSKTPTAK